MRRAKSEVIICSLNSDLSFPFFVNTEASKKGKKKEEGAGKKEKGEAIAPCVNYSELAVCNASGALHHLSMLDEAKVEIGHHGGAAILVSCMRCNPIQVSQLVITSSITLLAILVVCDKLNHSAIPHLVIIPRLRVK